MQGFINGNIMTNYAEIINFPSSIDDEPNNQEPPVVKADIDNGYVRIANDLNIALCKACLSSRESRFIQAVISKTFGYNKASDWICNAQISELTGILINHVSATKKSLLDRNIIFKDGNKVGINPTVSEWEVEKTPKSGKKIKHQNRVSKTPKSGRPTPKSGKKIPEIGAHKRQDNNTKDNIQKTKAQAPVAPVCLPSDLWLEFLEMRKAIKKPMTVNAQNRMIAKLEKMSAQGINVSECVEKSILNSWSDVYPPKQTKYSSNAHHPLNASAKTVVPEGWQPNTTLPGMEG